MKAHIPLRMPCARLSHAGDCAHGQPLHPEGSHSNARHPPGPRGPPDAAGLPLLPWCVRVLDCRCYLGARGRLALAGDGQQLCVGATAYGTSHAHVPACPQASAEVLLGLSPTLVSTLFQWPCPFWRQSSCALLLLLLHACAFVCVCPSAHVRACVCVCARVCVCNPPYLVGELHAPWRLCQEPEVLRQLRGSTGVRGFRAAQKPFSCNEDSGTTLTMHATHLLCNGPFQCVLVQGNGKGRPQNTARTWIWAQTTACIGAEHNLLCLHVCWRACRGSGGAGHKLPAASDAVLAEDIQYDARAGGCRRLAASRLAAVLKMAAVPGMGTREGSQCQGWQ